MHTTNHIYTKTAMWLHWVMAVMIIGLVVLGLNFDNIPREYKPLAYMLHKSFGMTILALTLVRIWWRITHRPPAPVEGLRPLEVRAARLGHLAFYGLMLALPLSGWVMSSAYGKYPTVIFGLFEVPHIPFPDGMKRSIGKNARQAHEIMGVYVITALFALHVLAALKHQYIDKVKLLQRMGLGGTGHD
jgi:cytochrome b561